MNSEIKEILERIKTYPEKLYCLSEKEKRILLDYITNLQQENERLKLEYKSQKDISQKLLSMDIKHNRELKDYKSKADNVLKNN